MSEKPKYYDIRADFWRDHFSRAEDWEAYLAGADPVHADKWLAARAGLPELSAAERTRLAGHVRQLKVLVYSGVWCGDCARQGPQLRQIADAVGDNVELRFIDRDASEPLRDELRVLGAMRVPMVVFLTEDWHEIGRFGDRLLTVYRDKLERELGEACSTGLVLPGAAELAAERAEWVDICERMLIMARLAPPLRARYGD